MKYRAMIARGISWDEARRGPPPATSLLAPRTCTEVIGGAGDTDSGLYWGIKASFVRYFAATPDGEFALLDGARVTSDASFYFPVDSKAEPNDTTRLEFCGEARFVAYAGVLRVSIANPAVEFDERRLTVDDWSRPGQRRVLATVDAVHVPLVRREPADLDLRARLTTDGVELFGGAYRVRHRWTTSTCGSHEAGELSRGQRTMPRSCSAAIVGWS